MSEGYDSWSTQSLPKAESEMNKKPMTICPKCGGSSISRPFYIPETPNDYNYLQYTCNRCGYDELIRPLDFKDDRNSNKT